MRTYVQLRELPNQFLCSQSKLSKASTEWAFTLVRIYAEATLSQVCHSFSRAVQQLILALLVEYVGELIYEATFDCRR